jgi:hypothetical protein
MGRAEAHSAGAKPIIPSLRPAPPMGFASLYPSYKNKKGAAIISRRLFVSANRSQDYFGCGTMRM